MNKKAGQVSQQGGRSGYEYFISDEMLKDYERKSVKLRLEWLYQLNKFRKTYPKNIIKLQEKFRRGEI